MHIGGIDCDKRLRYTNSTEKGISVSDLVLSLLAVIINIYSKYMLLLWMVRWGDAHTTRCRLDVNTPSQNCVNTCGVTVDDAILESLMYS